MARLTNAHDTLVRLQQKVYSQDQENQALKKRIQQLLNRVAAAEAAAAASNEAFQELLRAQTND